VGTVAMADFHDPERFLVAGSGGRRRLKILRDHGDRADSRRNSHDHEGFSTLCRTKSFVIMKKGNLFE
jgi:hypothetical protein